MEILNIGLSGKITIGVVILAGAGFTIYKLLKNKNTKDNFENHGNHSNNTSSTNSINKQDVEEKIQNYLNSYKNDCKNYDLAHFYSRVFEIKELQSDYNKKEKRKIIDDFDFTINEEKVANKVLRDLVEEKINKNFSNQYNQSNFWIFLLNFYKLQGKIEGLELIKSDYKIAEKDIEQYEKLKKENEEDLKSLIADFANDNS